MIEQLLTQIGSSAIVIGISGFIAKTWIKHQFEQASAKNSHELSKQIAKLNVHEPYLHKRRVEVIEEIYSKMLDAEFNLQNFLVTWWAHSNIEEITKAGFSIERAFSMEMGIKFCENWTAINAMLHKNSLYFEDDFIDEIRKAYKPFFDVIINMNESKPPAFPDEYKEIVSVGQEPRKSVISLFRRTLGVNR